MINNYQRDAGDEDDRDSGSLSLLASLAEGDQVESDDNVRFCIFAYLHIWLFAYLLTLTCYSGLPLLSLAEGDQAKLGDCYAAV